MSFIDYNFFPILFFLGWNILTTKQYKPTISNTFNSKRLPVLSTFSLTDLNGKKIVQTGDREGTSLKPEKKNDIIEFVSGFRFLSENQKAIRNEIENVDRSTNRNGKTNKAKTKAFPCKKKSSVFGLNSNKFLNRFENDIFIEKLCFSSQNNGSFWKKRSLISPIKQNIDLKYFFSNQSTEKQFNHTFRMPWNFNPEHPGRLGIFNNKIHKVIKKNHYHNGNSSFLTLAIRTGKLNDINFIQKRRSKIRLVLRVPIQKIYSLNKFQVALCFSKILQPYTRFNNNYRLSLPLKVYNSMFNYVRPHFSSNSQQNDKGRGLQVKKSQLKVIESDTFTKLNQKREGRLDNSLRKINCDMKTPFFQHIVWNMKYKIDFFDLHTTHLPMTNCNNFVKPRLSFYSIHHDKIEAKKQLKKQSYQKKKHCYDDRVKIKKTGLNTKAQTWVFFFNQNQDKNVLNYENHKSILFDDFSKKFQKQCFLKPPKFYENSNLIIYGGSWYYENLAFPYKDLLSSRKLQGKLKSDIGIYSLAHKLSSVGFQNGNSEINIYPFKYNDSYRYNFQNMNLSNYRFLIEQNSNHLKNETENTSQTRPKMPIQGKQWGRTKNNFSRGRAATFKTFLDFQNPTFSKIYAPFFQPQNLNVLSFLYNSFFEIIPNSIRNPQSINFISGAADFPETKEPIRFFSPSLPSPNRKDIQVSLRTQLESILNNNSSRFKNSKTIDITEETLPVIYKNLQNTTKKLKTFNRLYPELPINGIHANPYPWITQNASDRWSKSNSLFRVFEDSSSFSETELESSKTNSLSVATPFKGIFNRNTAREPVNHNNKTGVISPPMAFKNPNNFDSRSDFIEKPSYIKKPSVFFSSFRHLPYSFMSETLSTKGVNFPQTNLFLFPCFSMSNSSQNNSFKENQAIKKNPKMEMDLKKNAYSDISVPEYSLFFNQALKSNEKLKPWKGYLQNKSFSLKPLSIFMKKSIGYQTSLFYNKTFQHKHLGFNELSGHRQVDGLLNNKGSPVFKKQMLTNKDCKTFTPSLRTSLRNKTDKLQKNTWKIFPPLFQPLTFRFIDLNLPRTWSSDLLTFPLKTQTPLEPKSDLKNKQVGPEQIMDNNVSRATKKQLNSLLKSPKGNQKNFFRFPIPFYSSDFFGFSKNENNSYDTKSFLSTNNGHNNKNLEFFESTFSLSDFSNVNEYKEIWNNNQKNGTYNPLGFGKKNTRINFNERGHAAAIKFQNSKIIVYGEKPLLKNRTVHGPALKNQKESISLPSYLKNITNQNYQNLCPNNLNEFYFVVWILFNKTLFIYLSLHYLRKFISFLGVRFVIT